MRELKIRFIDTETTGLGKLEKGAIYPDDDVIELGYVDLIIYDDMSYKFDNEFSVRLKPRKTSFPQASKVHGIYFEDVEDCADSIEYLKRKLYKVGHTPEVYLEESTDSEKDYSGFFCFAGHNAPFDDKWLKLGLDSYIDTLVLAKKIHPEKGFERTNEQLYKYYNGNEIYKISKDQLHGAVADCYVTATIFIKILQTQEIPFDEIPNLIGKNPTYFNSNPVKKVESDNINIETPDEKVIDTTYIPKLVDKVGIGKRGNDTWSSKNDYYIKFYIGDSCGDDCYYYTRNQESYDPYDSRCKLDIDKLFTVLFEANKRGIVTEKSRYFKDKFFPNIKFEDYVNKNNEVLKGTDTKDIDVEHLLLNEVDDFSDF
jgi:DNA polymerase III epsilon subunit-like protein